MLARSMEPGVPEPRFEVDAMLIKLARYLRCLGYDASCDPELSLARRIARARSQGRAFLTRNTRVDEPGAKVLLVRGDDPVEQLAQVVAEAGLDPCARLFTRCIRCNVPLVEVPKDDLVRTRVPEGVWRQHERYWTCPSCATVFWHGSHVANTCRKLGIAPP